MIWNLPGRTCPRWIRGRSGLPGDWRGSRNDCASAPTCRCSTRSRRPALRLLGFPVSARARCCSPHGWPNPWPRSRALSIAAERADRAGGAGSTAMLRAIDAAVPFGGRTGTWTVTRPEGRRVRGGGTAPTSGLAEGGHGARPVAFEYSGREPTSRLAATGYWPDKLGPSCTRPPPPQQAETTWGLPSPLAGLYNGHGGRRAGRRNSWAGSAPGTGGGSGGFYTVAVEDVGYYRDGSGDPRGPYRNGWVPLTR